MNDKLIKILCNHLVSRQEEEIQQLRLLGDRLSRLERDINNQKDKLIEESFELASLMNKNGFIEQAKIIESSIVNQIIYPPYDMKRAIKTHAAIFSERHRMAMFLLDNMGELKTKALTKNTQNFTSAKKLKAFTYWHDDNDMPEIVKKCRESFEKYANDENIELITLNEFNYSDWVDLDKDLISKISSPAHFTDVLRMRLLEEYGGFWLDATCLLTRNLFLATELIREQDQFMFTYTGSRVGNWFIWSKPIAYIISLAIEGLSLWWKRKGILTNYFMTHDVIEMLYWIDYDYQKAWDKMLKIHPKNALEILRGFSKSYEKASFKESIDKSFIHKLTYKYDKELLTKNTIVKYLIQEYKS